MKVAVVFYSMYGHMHKMALAAAKSAGADVKLLRIAETLSAELLSITHSAEAQKAFSGTALVT